MIQPFGHMGPFDLLTEASLGGIVYPPSGPSNLTWDSVYTFEETSGNLIDQVGASDLTANGTPTYATTLQGRKGIDYDADGDRHAAAVHAPGTTSFVAFAVFASPHGANAGIMGGYSSDTAAEGWLVYVNSNTVKFDVRDTGSNSLILTSGAISAAATLHLVSIQVDKTANTLRARVTPRGGVGQALSGSIAGFAGLSAANHLYGFGGMPLINSSAVFYGGIRIHASTEGANTLPNLHRALGWE